MNASSSSSAKPNSDSILTLPDKIGTEWHYNTIKVTSAGREELNWTSTIVNSLHEGYLYIAVVLGLPGDLVWSGAQPKKKLSVLTIREDGLWIKSGIEPSSDTKELIEAVASGQDDALGTHILNANPKVDDVIEIPGTNYGYHVEKEILFEGQKGFRVRCMTRPDMSEYDFVSGIGLTRQVYIHHGTIQNLDANLVSIEIP
jgi:hypothetical protein